jgi:acylphosphatase
MTSGRETAGQAGGDAAVRVVAVVSGHVQGVGYRYFVRGLATAAGLTGSARNLPDGRVEVVLQGPPDAVDGVVAALDGPDAPGTVRAVGSRREPVREGSGFTTA